MHYLYFIYTVYFKTYLNDVLRNLNDFPINIYSLIYLCGICVVVSCDRYYKPIQTSNYNFITMIVLEKLIGNQFIYGVRDIK